MSCAKLFSFSITTRLLFIMSNQEQTQSPQTNWESFCCQCASYPGWTNEMTSEFSWSPLGCGEKDTHDGFCGVSIAEHEIEVRDVSGNKNTMKIEDVSIIYGICGCVNVEGLSKLDICRFLCGLVSCTKGSNHFASFFSCCIAGNGITCSKGDHGGCGFDLACFGCFLGKAKNTFNSVFWESGWKKF